MLTDDCMIKKADGTEIEIRRLTIGDEILSYDGSVQVVEDLIIRGFDDTYAVVTKKAGKKNVLYATLDTKLKKDNGEAIAVDQLRINTNLVNAGSVMGVALSGERKVYNIICEKPYMANGFIVCE